MPVIYGGAIVIMIELQFQWAIWIADLGNPEAKEINSVYSYLAFNPVQ